MELKASGGIPEMPGEKSKSLTLRSKLFTNGSFSAPVHPSPNPISNSVLRSQVHLLVPVPAKSAVPFLTPVLAWTLLCLLWIHFSVLLVLWSKKRSLVSHLRGHSSLPTQRPLHTICTLFPFNSPSWPGFCPKWRESVLWCLLYYIDTINWLTCCIYE